MTGSYDFTEVARSVVIAIAASYAALDLTGRVTAASGRARLAWLSGGAAAMGTGIWAMHFKGMLAFHLPVSVEYHWPTVLASLLVAILASAVALYVASRQKMGWVEALAGSVVMGAGIAGMHYIGMAAMRLPAITRFSPLLVTVSILLAMLFSLIALLMAFGLREETRWTVPRRLGSASVMGVAVSAMHYSGMAAASFMPASPPNLSHAVSITPFGNSGVVIVTLIVLVAVVITSSVDRRASAEVQQLNQDLERRVLERSSQLTAVNEELTRVARIAAMGELTASIAHEINQPLTAVATNASAALRWLAVRPPNLAEAQEAMASAMREANRAGRVIERVRTLLKKAPPEMRPLDVNEVIREILALVQRQLTSAGVAIHTQLVPAVPIVLGDRVQLQQVMLNLIMNGIDAMSAIVDRPRELVIKSAKHPDGVLIQVQDSGRGLDPEQADRIFEPFFTTKPEGIGMGLSISRSIVESHGGRLWATPGSPHGAVFHLILPAAGSGA
jgi:two-component system sensor histidine kinase/response regulator